jgi:hypothetical protein
MGILQASRSLPHQARLADPIGCVAAEISDDRLRLARTSANLNIPKAWDLQVRAHKLSRSPTRPSSGISLSTAPCQHNAMTMKYAIILRLSASLSPIPNLFSVKRPVSSRSSYPSHFLGRRDLRHSGFGETQPMSQSSANIDPLPFPGELRPDGEIVVSHRDM